MPFLLNILSMVFFLDSLRSIPQLIDVIELHEENIFEMFVTPSKFQSWIDVRELHEENIFDMLSWTDWSMFASISFI